MKAVTSSWSRGSIVPQRAASAELCGWEEKQAVLLAGLVLNPVLQVSSAGGASFHYQHFPAFLNLREKLDI